jgi:hypothetical protein
MLGNAEEVELQSCDGITSLRGFENFAMIVIENCGNLISLKGLGLGRNEYITLDIMKLMMKMNGKISTKMKRKTMTTILTTTARMNEQIKTIGM